jgi:hypothetical protein
MDSSNALKQSQPVSKPKATGRLFENLVSLTELVEGTLGGRFSKFTIYKWVGEGMPKEKIGGRLYFNPGECQTWIERTKKT